MSHHCSPQSLHLLRFFFFFFFFFLALGMCRFFWVLSTRVNTRSTSRAERPAGSDRAVPDPRNPGPESELSRVCPDPCRDPGSLSPCHITARDSRKETGPGAGRPGFPESRSRV